MQEREGEGREGRERGERGERGRGEGGEGREVGEGERVRIRGCTVCDSLSDFTHD